MTPRPSRLARIVAAGTISAVGDGMTMVAIPLYATELTGDPRLMALLRVLPVLPWLLFGLASGVVADRVARRRLMIAADLARAALLGTLAVAAQGRLDELWPLYAVVVLAGAAQTLFDSSAPAFLVDTVGDAGLERGTALVLAGQSAGVAFVGPALGGLLFAWSPAVVFAADAASFLCSAALLWTVRGVRRRVTPAGARFAGQLADGLRYVFRHPTLRTFAVLVAVVNIGHTTGNSVVVLFTQQNLGLSHIEYGVFVTCEAAGALIGSAVAHRVGARLGTWPVLRVTIAVSAGMPAVLASATGPWAAYAILVVDGIVLGVWNVGSSVARMRIIPAGLRGRATAVYRVVAQSALLAGGALGGTIAWVASPRAAMIAGGVAGAAVTCLLARRLRAPDPRPGAVVR